MINQKEILILLSSALVLGYVISFSQFTFAAWAIAFLLAVLILGVNTVGKKTAANFFDSNAER